MIVVVFNISLSYFHKFVIIEVVIIAIFKYIFIIFSGVGGVNTAASMEEPAPSHSWCDAGGCYRHRHSHRHTQVNIPPH